MKKVYIILISVLLAFCITALVVGQGNYEEMTGWQRWLYAATHAQQIKDTNYVGKVSTDRWSETDEYRLEDHAVIVKDPNRDFVVMNLTDFHLAEYDYTYLNNVKANRSYLYIKEMVAEVQPDLITISGDIFCEDGDSNIYAVHRLTEFFDELGIYWAPIFDWHDEQGNCDMNYIADIMMESEFCLFRKGDPALGIGNYVINVVEEKDGVQTPVHSILMMHTHHGNFWDNQIQWYKWAANGINELAGEKVTSSVIMHVPFAQYDIAYNEAWDEENGCWKDGYGAFGVKGESICCERDENGEPLDNGFFAAMQEVGTTTNTICGHEHVNFFSIEYQGIRLTYSLSIGLSCYGDNSNETDSTGATLLVIDGDGNGTVSHHFYYSELYPDGVRADK